MVNIGSSFLSQPPRRSEQVTQAFQAYPRESGEARQRRRRPGGPPTLRKPPSPGDLEHVLDHIDYMAGIAGVEAVGIGTDFDGDTLPIGMGWRRPI